MMMMAVKSPMMASPSHLVSAFSPYSESPSTPVSHRTTRSGNAATEQLKPLAETLHAAQSVKSPSSEGSLVAPSPVSTDGTEIDDSSDAGDQPEELAVHPIQARPASQPRLNTLHGPDLSLNIQPPSEARPRSDEDEPPQSVIHAPRGFGEFKFKRSPPSATPSVSSTTQSDPTTISTAPSDRTTTSPSQRSDSTVKSPTLNVKTSERRVMSPVSPPPITTSMAPMLDWIERATPRAQTRQEVEAFEKRPLSRSLEDIPEGLDSEGGPEGSEEGPESATTIPHLTHAVGNFQDTEEELNALKAALGECWTLCNTLANLSYIHRERLFNFSGKGNMQEQAWKTCWKLCQKLYDSRDDDYASQVRPTLDLCRDFCQALFEVRVREDELADSVLRVSFELNNHLFNTHDRHLPLVFRERTLDFYITLCHRLMKQRTRLAEETDTLLRACWALAEMLFNLRQNKREGKQPDEELLGSAVQACWELCDLFREGWTQIRPDRGTPRPSQTTFTYAFNQIKQTAYLPEDTRPRIANPETPTTIFEDTLAVSPEEDSTAPNILVLGPESQGAIPAKWSSASSTHSAYSQSSERTTSSNNTVTTPSEDPNLTRLKLLVIKAAINSGYQRGGAHSLPTFVKSMPSNSFGNLQWQMGLLDQFKKLVLSDPAFRTIGPPSRAGAPDVALAVLSMVQSGQYTWLRDLFRLVFGFHVEEAGDRKVSIQT